MTEQETNRVEAAVDREESVSSASSEASVSRTSRISAVWIVPIAALVIAAWTFTQQYLAQGPEVTITFASAEGLVPGETQVKTLDVEIGVVEEVRLADDFSSVQATVRLDPATRPLLTEDAQFWIVRPQIGSQGISGLSTLLSGSYIQLSPGTSTVSARSYRGLDEIPVTNPSTPGLSVQLLADEAGSINVGSPVLYNGYRVGRIEEFELDTLNGQTRYSAFIDAPYNDLVTTTTRFWNASGISMSVGVDGFDLRTESLEALLTGGVTFATPEGSKRGQPASKGSLFLLYPDESEIRQNPHQHAAEYLLMFDSSIRGLEPGAAVDYRGMRVGTVLTVGLQDVEWEKLWKSESVNSVPVLVQLEPGWLGQDTEQAAAAFADSLSTAVDSGLRASLAIGNLLTGGMYVSLDFYADAAPAKIIDNQGTRQLPTVASGLDQIERKVGNFLSKLQQLPLEETLTITNSAIEEIETTVASSRQTLTSLDKLLSAPATNDLPASVRDTLHDAQQVLQALGPGSGVQLELVQTLRSLKQVLSDADAVVQNYELQPNAFVFPTKTKRDPEVKGSNE